MHALIAYGPRCFCVILFGDSRAMRFLRAALAVRFLIIRKDEETMKCQNCGAEIGDKTVCEFCGSQITAEMQKDQEMFNRSRCPKCDSTNVKFSRENQGEVRGKNSKKVIHTTVGVCKDLSLIHI